MKSKENVKILYVEDDESLRQIVSDLFYLKLGFKIHTISSGNKAIDALKNEAQYDLIISDYLMNDGTGADLQKFMKDSLCSIPFILFTNSMNPNLPERSSGFSGIIQKHKAENLLTFASSLFEPCSKLSEEF